MRKQLLRFMSLVSVALAVCFFTPQRAAADDDDPPSRVARLAFTSGNISFNPAGTDDWVAAVVNRPMTTGDKLWSDDNSRAELHLGYAVIRLSDHTGFSFLNLADDITQLRLTEGTLNIRLRRLGDDETFEVDTPNLALSILRPGSYRINVNEGGDATIVAVRDGQGEITGGGSAYTIHAREQGIFSGTDQLDADIQQGLPDHDDFDRWSYDRDSQVEHSASARYVSDDVVGYEDLDANGAWRPVPDYGNVWFPSNVVVGWAPYRYGHWVWIAPWGWTWVDDAPWGFAPFHYGRWVVVGGVWGWVPSPPRPVVVGAVYVRPVYAPALVAWVGGPHFGVGVAVGAAPAAGVAWFPLGPRDVYCPSYHVSQTYVTNVNVSNTVIVNRTQVTNVYNNVYVNKTVNVTNVTYQNQTQVNAVTATSRETFVSAGAVHNNMIRVDAKEVASAPVAPMTPAVAPQQRSVVGAGAQARFTPPAAVANRAVVAKAAPPPAPVSFAKQQQLVQANGGRPPAISQIRQPQPEVSAGGRANASANANASVKMAPPVRQGPAQNAPANRVTEDAQRGNANRPGQGNSNPANPPTPPNANAGNANRPANASSNQPGTPNNANQPGANRPGNAPANSGNGRGYNDRPPSSRPANGGNSNPQVEQKQQQQPQNSRSNQDQERPKAEPQPVQEKQNNSNAQSNANAQRQQNAGQRQPQVEQGNASPQNNSSAQSNANAQRQQNGGQKPPQVQQTQKPPQVQQTRQRQDKPAKPPKQDKPSKQEKEKKEDKPHR